MSNKTKMKNQFQYNILLNKLQKLYFHELRDSLTNNKYLLFIYKCLLEI